MAFDKVQKPSHPRTEQQASMFKPRPFAVQGHSQIDLAISQQPSVQQSSGSDRLSRMSITPPDTSYMPRLQTKLTIGAPGDRYEQEADRVARKAIGQINAPVDRSVQGQVSSHNPIEKQLTVQREAEPSTGEGMDPENQSLSDRVKAGIESLSDISMLDLTNSGLNGENLSRSLENSQNHVELRLKSAPSSLSSPIDATGGVVIQRAKQNAKPNRQRNTRYKTANYRKSSKFRLIRWRRRSLDGYTSKAKAGINLFTVKYKKGKKSYYLTTRSVPNTNANNFKLPTGHSEDRFGYLKTKFEKKHKLEPKHIQWGATEREPCGEGVGMANCRQTLATLGIPEDKIFFGTEYADREDMRSTKNEKSSDLNELASEHRHEHNAVHEQNVQWLRSNHDSDAESEDESNVLDEYESDYEENVQKRRKKANKNLKNAYRGGFDKDNA